MPAALGALGLKPGVTSRLVRLDRLTVFACTALMVDMSYCQVYAHFLPSGLVCNTKKARLLTAEQHSGLIRAGE
ncbi:hypothetical protein GE09DRAFT_739141 [Coniochaeta sp. 2T2.1]|nr:hypothetical protein GE09DRAFT_739141 [Coniochaeta sp. 2T2.1]